LHIELIVNGMAGKPKDKSSFIDQLIQYLAD